MLVIPKLSYEANRRQAKDALRPREANNIQPNKRDVPYPSNPQQEMEYVSIHSGAAGRNDGQMRYGSV